MNLGRKVLMARGLGLGKKSESLAQLGSNEETNIAVEKKNLQDSQTQ